MVYMKANPQVCFTVGRQLAEVREHAGGNPCHVDSDSVVCYGRARMIEDLDERSKAVEILDRFLSTGMKNSYIVEMYDKIKQLG